MHKYQQGIKQQAKRDLMSLTVTFRQGDEYRVHYGKHQMPHCPAGLQTMVAHESKDGSCDVTYKSYGPTPIIVAESMFYGRWTECMCVQDESRDWWRCPQHGKDAKNMIAYIEGQKQFYEYRNELIERGAKDRRPGHNAEG